MRLVTERRAVGSLYDGVLLAPVGSGGFARAFHRRWRGDFAAAQTRNAPLQGAQWYGERMECGVNECDQAGR